MAEESRALFSERVSAKGKNYFFDVRKTKTGGNYLMITESRPKDQGFEHIRIMVFEDHLADFQAGLAKAIDFVVSQPGGKSATAAAGRK
jgi:hypothetical protein